MLVAKKALKLGSKLSSGSMWFSMSLIQCWKLRLGLAFRGGTKSNFSRLRLVNIIRKNAWAWLRLNNWKLQLDSVFKISARSYPYHVIYQKAVKIFYNKQQGTCCPGSSSWKYIFLTTTWQLNDHYCLLPTKYFPHNFPLLYHDGNE